MASRRLYSAASRLRASRNLAIGNEPRLLRHIFTVPSRSSFPDTSDENPFYRRRRRSDRNLSPFDMFQDLWDPLLSSRNLKQMMDTVDRVSDDSARTFKRSADEGGMAARTPWDVRSKEDAYYLRVDMPGLGKEEVRISVEDGRLIIKGEPAKNEEDEWSRRSYDNYLTRVALPDDAVHNEIKAEMKNGVLKVTIPKAKADAKSSTFNVQVD